MLDFITSQRAAFVLALSDLYREGTLTQAGPRVSDGRGGFTGNTFSHDVRLHREETRETLAGRNVEPDEALIYVLNDRDDMRPNSGDTISLDGHDYTVLSLTTDPLSVTWECVCAKG